MTVTYDQRLAAVEAARREAKIDRDALYELAHDTRTAVRLIERKLAAQSSRSAVIEGDVAELKADVRDLKADMRDMKIDVRDLKVGLQEVRQSVVTMQEGMVTMQESVGMMQEGMVTMQESVGTMQGNMVTMQQNVAELHQLAAVTQRATAALLAHNGLTLEDGPVAVPEQRRPSTVGLAPIG